LKNQATTLKPKLKLLHPKKNNHFSAETIASMLVGLDEVGRGCWAGPLVAGAVILNKPITGLRDSKKLSALQRERLSVQILAEAEAYGIGWVEPSEVDALGLTKSVGLAMRRALEHITASYDQIIIDGSYNFFPEDVRAEAVIKADDCVPAVSAASIIAKVARDRYMSKLAQLYPAYGFEKHVGYGTAYHLAMLQAHGVSDVHRLSYKPIKVLLNVQAKKVQA
jgi:ribonuclease HII